MSQTQTEVHSAAADNISIKPSTNASKDTSNFFKRADYDEKYWDDYLAARPHYDDAFYASIYAYHEAHGGQWQTAHDVATGPGHVAARLAERDFHVTASDNNSTHLAVAQRRLDDLVKTQRVQLAECSAESLLNIAAPASVDLITAAECLPLIDARKALDAFATALKPQGSLAIWFYGRPRFSEPDYAAKCQPILNSILDISFAKLIKGGGPQHKAGWKQATDRMTSFLDDIELDGNVWHDVQRHKWNPDCPMPFYGPDACDFPVERSSRIGPGETIHEKQDPDFWARQWDLAGVRRFVSVNLPTFDDKVLDEEVEAKYKTLQEAMGGEGSIRKITWPVVLILASKA